MFVYLPSHRVSSALHYVLGGSIASIDQRKDFFEPHRIKRMKGIMDELYNKQNPKLPLWDATRNSPQVDYFCNSLDLRKLAATIS
jgi:hypothetical protein